MGGRLCLKSKTILFILLATLSILKLTYTADDILESFPEDIKSLIGLGKEQYKALYERASLPVYGSCWTDAVKNLDSGCKQLNEHVQRNIALRFTDCFLEMSGHKTYACGETIDSMNDCVTGMTDRAFNAYTEFYTHTQNICFYLRSQIWREETENSIYRLSRTSMIVTEQLEQAEEMQSSLLEHQKKSMSVQLELLDNGESLNEILRNSQNSLHNVMTEFRLSTLEQKKMLYDVFDRLSSLQAWAVGEISWLDTVIFYLSSSVLAYIFTATSRTQGARILIFLAISVNVLIERSVCTYLLKDTDTEINNFNEHLYWWIWICRKILIVVCIFILGICMYRYRDYNLVNHELLLDIQQQNLRLIEQIRTLDCSFTSSPAQYIPTNYSYTSTPLFTHTVVDSPELEIFPDQCPENLETGMKNRERSVSPITFAERSSTPIKYSDRSVTPARSPEYSLTSPKSPSPALSTVSNQSTEVRLVRRATSRKPVMEITSSFSRYSLRSLSRRSASITVDTVN